MTLTLRQLIDAWGTPQGGTFEPDARVGRVCTDSRQLQAGDFFLPLVGERFDGHHFLDQMPERKVQAAVVSRSWAEPLPPEKTICSKPVGCLLCLTEAAVLLTSAGSAG